MNKIAHIKSLSKIFWNYRRKRTQLSSKPVRLWIESTNICNLKCPMCPNKELPADTKGVMGFDLFKKIIDEAGEFVYDIYLHHRGEPLINPDLVNFIRYARQRRISVKFHTNASLLTQEWTQHILKSDLDLLSFSIDGLDKEKYESIRQGATFEKTLDNIAGFLEIRSKTRKRKPYTIIEVIDFPEEPITPTVRKHFSQTFRRLGLDELIFKEPYNWAGSTQIPGMDLRERAFTMCTFPWYAMVILFDGTVVPCPQDFFAHLTMGNVTEQTLIDIWNGKNYTNLRRQMLKSVDNLAPCNNCDRLWRKQKMGLPFQYMITFLNDNLIGYGRLRKLLGSYERNE